MIYINESIPAESAYKYRKQVIFMTKEEREQHYDERRKAVARWTRPMRVETIHLSDTPPEPVEQSNYTTNDTIPSISIVGNTWVKQMIFEKAGDVQTGHAHLFDHQTLLAAGSVEVWANGETTKFVAPTIIYIKAGVRHGMIALEDGTVVYCIHPLRDGDQVGDIIDPASVPNGVRPLVEGGAGKINELISTDQI